MIWYTYTTHPLSLSRMDSERSLPFLKCTGLSSAGDGQPITLFWVRHRRHVGMSPMRPIATAQIAPYPIEMTKRRETITGRNAKLCIGTNKKKIAKTKVDKKKWYQSFGEGSTEKKRREERTREMPIEYNLCWLIVDCEYKTAVSLNIYLAGVSFPVRLRLFQKAFFFFFFFESSTSGEEQRERFEGLIAFFLLFFRVLL